VPRESAETKARRYLAEGRLTVLRVGEIIGAECRGSGVVYRLGFDGRDWFCECPALSRRCSHLLALQSVTVLPEARPR